MDEAVKAFWERHNAKERARHLAAFDTDAYVDEKGVARWKSNGGVPPTEILNVWHEEKKPFDFVLSISTGKAETAGFIQKYREARAQRTPEQIEEERMMARGAVGEGHTLIDVFTGERIST